MSARLHDEFLAATLPALDLVYGLARRMVAGSTDVEDLVQETYLKAFEAWAKGRKPRRVEPWMATICLNTGRSWLRRASARHELLVEDPPVASDAADVEREATGRVMTQMVHDALWRLPEEQRIAISLMDLGGFTASEVARITGAPRGTVLARVHRGRKKLAQMVETGAMRLEP